ncbi:hypothetical protein [Granulicoccus sp. GXG6511]|uniref:hypothetical protein n=1 Tax=Granulicoccus sp. GXG6511 TaxID=3381351 RepID=UPI003D7DA29A
MRGGRFSRRTGLAGLGGLVVAALTGCGVIPGARARPITEDWLDSRPWVASFSIVRTEGWGPVPLPTPLTVWARVHTVAGTDRPRLTAIAREVEEFVAAESGQVRALYLDLDFDAGRLPLGGDAAQNQANLAEIDRATEPRADRLELVGEHDGPRLTVTTRSEAVLAYAAWLTAQSAAPTPPRLTVRDGADALRIDTAFGHTAAVRSIDEVVSTASALAPVLGFHADTTRETTTLRTTVSRRGDLDRVFRAIRSRWSRTDLDVTVLADGLGVRGSLDVLERLPAANALIAAAAFTELVVQDAEEATQGLIHLVARLTDPATIAAAATAIGAHPDATGSGRAWLVLDPIARLRLAGSPADVADCGGPAQAVLTGPGSRPSADGRDRALRLTPDAPVAAFPAVARAIRAAGWTGELAFTIDQGLFSVRYASTATGRAREVTVLRSVGTIDGAAAWIRAWDDSATE